MDQQQIMLTRCSRDGCGWIGPSSARRGERCPKCRAYAPVWAPDLAKQQAYLAAEAKAEKAARQQRQALVYEQGRATVEAYRRALHGVGTGQPDSPPRHAWHVGSALMQAQQALKRWQKLVERRDAEWRLAVATSGRESTAAQAAAQRLQAARTEAFEAQAELEACLLELDEHRVVRRPRAHHLTR
jgi:hypothetical protein